MEQQSKAALEVIQAKRDYESGNKDGKNDYANEVRSQFGLDDSRYGKGVSLADALTNYMEDFGNIQRGAGDRPQPQQDMGNQSYDDRGTREELEGFYKGSADGYYANQEAALGQALQQQIQQLEMAYAEAIENGEISVRDAQRDFEAQKSQIEKTAYQQAEATKAHASNMGIVHSQQMIGMQQGDNARVNDLHNTNMSDRDNRIADIKTRMNTIKTQKDLQIAGAKAQHDYGLAGARGQADMMYNQAMGGFMQEDFFNQQKMGHDRGMQQDRFAQEDYMSDKTHGQNIDLESIRQRNTLAQLAEQHGYRLEEMSESHILELERMDEANKYVVENMKIQHGLSLEMLEEQILGQLRTIDRSASHTASENAKNRSAQASNIAKQIKAQEDQYEKQLERDLRGVTPGTKEYEIIVGRNRMQLQAEKDSYTSQYLTQYTVENTLGNNNLPKPGQPEKQKPRDRGGFLNFFTGYNKDLKGYNAEQEAIRRKNELIKGK